MLKGNFLSACLSLYLDLRTRQGRSPADFGWLRDVRNFLRDVWNFLGNFLVLGGHFHFEKFEGTEWGLLKSQGLYRQLKYWSKPVM